MSEDVSLLDSNVLVALALGELADLARTRDERLVTFDRGLVALHADVADLVA